MKKPSEILDNAANIILRDGWYQHKYYVEPEFVGDGEDCERDLKAKKSAPCCQAGAINRAVFGVAWRSYVGYEAAPDREQQLARSEAESFMRRYVKDTFGVSSPIEWNDQQGRTAEEVVEALRGAAELARAGGA